MEREIKVSVIIPVYNVETYISKCISSVIEQNYKNIEIILIDDGSQDSSGKILDEYEKKDDRITVIHQKNKGVSAARNRGLELASGDYVVFVDGDDWVDSDYVSYFVELLQNHECEIGMNVNNYTAISNRSNENTYIISSEKAMEWLYLDKIFVAVWNKIYDMQFLKRNKIKFDEKIWFGEGMLFNIDCLQFADNVAIGEKCVYHQISNPGSAMRNFNLKSNYCGIDSLYIQRSHWKKSNKKIINAWKFHRYAFNWTIMGGLSRSNQECKYIEEYKKCAKSLRKNIFQAMKVKIPIKSKLMYLCIAICPYLMAKREKRKVRY